VETDHQNKTTELADVSNEQVVESDHQNNTTELADVSVEIPSATNDSGDHKGYGSLDSRSITIDQTQRKTPEAMTRDP